VELVTGVFSEFLFLFGGVLLLRGEKDLEKEE